MGQKMEAAFKIHPNPNPASQLDHKPTTSLLSTLQRHKKSVNKNESATVTKPPTKPGEKREKRSSFKTFFNKIGSRGILLYNRQEGPSDHVENKPLMVTNEDLRDKKRSRQSLSVYPRSEFFSYVKCDDPTDGLTSWTLDRKTLEKKDADRLPKLKDVSPEKDVKKASTLKRSHFPYSFLRSKLGTLPEDHHLILSEYEVDGPTVSPPGPCVDVSRQSSLTSLDYRLSSPHLRNFANRRLTRNLSLTESGYDSDSGWNGAVAMDISNGPFMATAGSTEVKDMDFRLKHIVIKQRNEVETLDLLVTRSQVASSNLCRWIVTGLMENGAAHR